MKMWVRTEQNVKGCDRFCQEGIINTALRRMEKRSLDLGCIMDTSGEPVSKYRVKVYDPGRPENILVSGAPTCLGHRSLFLDPCGGRQLNGS